MRIPTNTGLPPRSPSMGDNVTVIHCCPLYDVRHRILIIVLTRPHKAFLPASSPQTVIIFSAPAKAVCLGIACHGAGEDPWSNLSQDFQEMLRCANNPPWVRRLHCMTLHYPADMPALHFRRPANRSFHLKVITGLEFIQNFLTIRNSGII